jgi:hypothetical protein
VTVGVYRVHKHYTLRIKYYSLKSTIMTNVGMFEVMFNKRNIQFARR